MDWLVYVGTAVCLIGLAGVVYCLVNAVHARRYVASDPELRLRVQKLVPLNYGALLLAVLGLCFVVVGLIL